jgi:hypothetical protein
MIGFAQGPRKIGVYMILMKKLMQQLHKSLHKCKGYHIFHVLCVSYV